MPVITKTDLFDWCNAQVTYKVVRIRVTNASSSQPELPWGDRTKAMCKGRRYVIKALSAEDKKSGRRQVDTFIIKINRNGRIVRD